MNTCKTCRFFENGAVGMAQRPVSLGGAEERGACRLHPPVTMLVGMTQDLSGRATPGFAAISPSVTVDDWCGDYKPRNGPSDPLVYDGSRGEFNRTPTPEEMRHLAESVYRASRGEQPDPPYGGTD